MEKLRTKMSALGKSTLP